MTHRTNTTERIPTSYTFLMRFRIAQWFVGVYVLVYEVVHAKVRLQRVVDYARSLIASPYWPEVILSVWEPGLQVCNTHGSM